VLSARRGDLLSARGCAQGCPVLFER